MPIKKKVIVAIHSHQHFYHDTILSRSIHVEQGRKGGWVGREAAMCARLWLHIGKHMHGGRKQDEQ